VTRHKSVIGFNTQTIERDPRVAAALSSFGKKNRPQTPVKGIITNEYGQDAEVHYRKQSDDVQARVSQSNFCLSNPRLLCHPCFAENGPHQEAKDEDRIDACP
jgi:hypothetical protein